MVSGKINGNPMYCLGQPLCSYRDPKHQTSLKLVIWLVQYSRQTCQSTSQVHTASKWIHVSYIKQAQRCRILVLSLRSAIIGTQILGDESTYHFRPQSTPSVSSRCGCWCKKRTSYVTKAVQGAGVGVKSIHQYLGNDFLIQTECQWTMCPQGIFYTSLTAYSAPLLQRKSNVKGSFLRRKLR